MKHVFLSRHFITAIIFCGITVMGMFGFFFSKTLPAAVAQNASGAFSQLRTYLSSPLSAEASHATTQNISAYLNNIDGALGESVSFYYPLVSEKGFFMNLMNQYYTDEVDVVRLKNGSLYTYEDVFITDFDAPNRARKNAEAVAAYSELVTSSGSAFLFVLPPYKTSPYDPTLPAGFADVYNNIADAFISELDARGVDYIDMREVYSDVPRSEFADYFFRTDHHWTPETALDATRIIAKYLNSEQNIAINADKLSAENWDRYIYENYFLGSLGRKTGAGYSGIEDISLLYPSFKTDFTMRNFDADKLNTGAYMDVIVEPDKIDYSESIYTRSGYSIYGNNFSHLTIENNMPENDTSVLLIKDSYGIPVADFLAASVKTVDAVDYRYYADSPKSRLFRDTQPDVVLMLVCNLTVSEYFQF